MKLQNLNRYAKLARFLFKYGTSDLVKNAGLADNPVLREESSQNNDVRPQEMVDDLVAMGPAFVKLGQLLSTRPDVLPAPYITALSELQDNVGAIPYEEIEKIVEEELGISISKAFNSFCKEPLASASLGQVHAGELRDGTKVVIKVQRPGIRQEVMHDLEVLESTADLLEKNTRAGKQLGARDLIAHFKKTLLRELNYLKEAEHMNILGKNLEHFEHLLVPTAIEDYTSDKVLTMQFLKGKKITEISPLRKIEIEGAKLVDELFEAYLQQIVIDGFMHADPHPGNTHLTDDGRIALLDMGMVYFIGDETKEKYLKILLYLGDAKGDKLAPILKQMSRQLEDANPEKFEKEIDELVQENRYMTMANLETGKLIFEVIRIAGQNGFVLPVGLSLIGKALLNLDQVGLAIAPDFDPRRAIRKHVMDLMQKYTRKNLTSHNFLTTLLESKEFLEHLPARLNLLMHNAAENKLKINVDALDEKKLVSGFQKIANRITIGLIIAALLISAAMLMNVPSTFMLFGYPGLAILAFLAALAGALIVVVRIFFRDE